MGYRGDTGDPYVDSQTGVLRNLAGIGNAALLEDYEGEMSIVRQFELAEAPLTPSFDLAHLKAIHGHLFQDVYDWAGEPRTVDISKGTSRFGSHLHVESFLSKLFTQLSKERETWKRTAPPHIRQSRNHHGREQSSAHSGSALSMKAQAHGKRKRMPRKAGRAWFNDPFSIHGHVFFGGGALPPLRLSLSYFSICLRPCQIGLRRWLKVRLRIQLFSISASP